MTKITWKLHYKCRTCGEVQPDEKTALTDKLEIHHIKHMLSFHTCQDGTYGVMDLLGAKEYEENE